MHPLLLTLYLSLSFVPPASAADRGSGGVSLWCVARNDADEGSLQKALDWACNLAGGGVDCSQVQQGGVCFEPEDLQFHASYAFNEYYLHHSTEAGACDFAGNAAVSQLNPATSIQNVNPGCKFRAIVSTGSGSIVGNVSAADGTRPGGGGGDQPNRAVAGRRVGGSSGVWWRWAWAIQAALSFWAI